MARTVPVPVTEVPGNFITSALWTAQVAATMNWTMGSGSNGPPRFKGYATSAQTITSGSGSDTPISLDTEAYDSDNGHSTTTNTSRYVIQVAGTYLILATGAFDINATGNRKVGINVNGANALGGAFTGPSMSSNSWVASVGVYQALNVGDYVELVMWQTSGANLVTKFGGAFGPALMCHWISS